MTLELTSSACVSPKVQASIEQLALNAEADSRGAVFTRREVVDFILDLAGYTQDQPLYEKRLLEPSFGGGDFLLPIVERLLSAWRAARPNGSALDDLGAAIQAVEIRYHPLCGWYLIGGLSPLSVHAHVGRTQSHGLRRDGCYAAAAHS